MKNKWRLSRLPAYVKVNINYYFECQSAVDAAIRGKSLSSQLAREWAHFLALIFASYFQPENWKAGKPRKHFPRSVALMLGELMWECGSEEMPKQFAALKSKGRRKTTSEEGSAIFAAVTYVLAARQKLIRDRAPVKTIATLYSVDERTVMRWAANYNPRAMTCHLVPFEESIRKFALERNILEGAEKYRRVGRGAAQVRTRNKKRPT